MSCWPSAMHRSRTTRCENAVLPCAGSPIICQVKMHAGSQCAPAGTSSRLSLASACPWRRCSPLVQALVQEARTTMPKRHHQRQEDEARFTVSIMSGLGVGPFSSHHHNNSTSSHIGSPGHLSSKAESKASKKESKSISPTAITSKPSKIRNFFASVSVRTHQHNLPTSSRQPIPRRAAYRQKVCVWSCIGEYAVQTQQYVELRRRSRCAASAQQRIDRWSLAA